VADVRVNLRPKSERWQSSIDIVLELRPPIAELARQTGANIKLVEDPPGPPVRATILAELYGPDYAQLRKIARELRREVFEQTEDVVDIDDSVTDDWTEYRIVVNRERAMLAGIAPAQVAETLQAFLAGSTPAPCTSSSRRNRCRSASASRPPTAPGRRTCRRYSSPARRAGRCAQRHRARREPRRAQADPHKDQYPVVYVSGELGSSSQVYAVLKMWNWLRNHELPSGTKLTQYFMADPDTSGYALRWDGEMRLTLDVFRDLGSAFAVAIVLIYLTLVGYYRSFAIPLIVMGAIPLTVVGVLPGHMIMGSTSPPPP
jgi:multidrug efflux pump subunit AcrB